MADHVKVMTPRAPTPTPGARSTRRADVYALGCAKGSRVRRAIIPFLAILVSVPVAAQEPQTRAETLRQEREEKAQHTTRYAPNGLERTLLWLENDRLLERLLNPAEGIYPKIGNVTAGSGFAFGPAYRSPGLFGGHADFSTFGIGSLTRYWMLDARLSMPRLANGSAFAVVYGQRSDFPSEDFFGLGRASRREDQSTFGLRNTIVGVRGGVRPASWLSIGGGIEHLSPRTGGGREGASIETVFDPATIVGLADSADFMRYEVFADLNYREPRGNPRRGGQYVLSFEEYDDRTSDRYGFSRIEADVQQYIPFLKDRRVLALRVHTSLSDARSGQQMPFYLQRTLGGPDDLRGFRRFRFRDDNLLLLQAEYRWEIFTALDGAIFYDAGKVASERGDLTLDDLESDYCIGFRFGTINGLFLRVEGAFGSSGGKHFVLRYGHVF
jgi:hypothetical protein